MDSEEMVLSIAKILYSTFTISNQSDRKQAEESLFAYATKPDSFFSALMTIVSSPKFDTQIKNSAAVNLRKFIKETSENNLISQNSREVIALSIFSAMCDGDVASQVKTSLSYALMPILNVDMPDPANSTLTRLIPEIEKGLSQGSFAVAGSCKAIRAAFGGYTANESLYPFFQHLQGLLVLVTKRNIGSLKETNDPEVALGYVELLHDLTATFTSIIEHFDICSKEKLKGLSEMYDVAEIFSEILKLNIKDPLFSEPQFLCVSAEPLFKVFSHVKSQVFQSLNLVLDFLLENRKTFLEEQGRKVMTLIGVDMPDSPFVNMLYDLLDPIVRSLHSLINLPSFEQLIETEHVSELVVESLLLLQKLSRENKFSHFFNTHYKGLIAEVILVFLRVTAKDLEELQESPDQFVAASADLCEQKDSENLKSVACEFLESLCDSSDGALTFTTDFCCEMIDFALTQQLLSVYPNLSQFSSSRTLDAPAHIIAENGLISLCVISYSVLKRRDLVNLLEGLLVKRWELLVAITSEVVQQRFCMLLHYFTEKLFTVNSEFLAKIVQLVINYCSPQLFSAGTNAQGASTVNYFFTEEDIADKLESVLAGTWPALIQLLTYSMDVNFFDALQEVVVTHFASASEYLAPLITALVQKIQSAMAQDSDEGKKKKKRTIFIIKCWNIIRFISAHRELGKEQLLSIEQLLLPVFEYIKKPNEIDFDDDILLFEVSLMRKAQTVSPVGWTILTHLPLIQEKYEGTFLQLFPILNCFIYYGKDHIMTDTGILQNLVRMCGRCLFAVYKKKENEAANAEGALIYQQILQTFGGYVDSMLHEIFATVVSRLQSPIRNNFFRTRLLDVILCGFWCNTNTAVAVLDTISTREGENGLTFVLRLILSNWHIFVHSYDRKIASFGLVSLLVNPNAYIEINNNILGIFQALISVLISYETAQENNLVKLENQLKVLGSNETDRTALAIKANKFIKMNKDRDSEEIEADLGLSTFLYPLKDNDEFELFKNTLKQLQAANQELLSYLVGNLSEIQVSQLNNVVKTKHVELSGFDTPVIKERRVVKARRHNFN